MMRSFSAAPTGSRISASFFEQPNSFCQSNSHDDNTSQAFYFCSVLPSAAGGGRQRVGDQRQPFRVPVQFAPAADIALAGHEEIDRALEFMGPVFLRGDRALPGIDLNN